MEAFLLEYGNLLLRWLHVIAAIAWIGESVYFVMLDNSLHPPLGAESKKRGVFGEMWSVHGGGFYHNQKYLTNPAELPDDLHWSFWKAYSTWLSGFALFTLMYLLKPEFYLVNTASPWQWAAQLSGWQASVLAVLFLIIGYNVYSQLCRRISPKVDHDGALSVAVGIMMIVASWLSVNMFSGRAAFLITGALMATCMAANVYFWIIPGQHRMVDALKADQKPNPLDGARGKQRSVHNTYFTLPVIFLMLSNHYAFTYTSPYAWIIMALFIFAGAIIRQYFVMRHVGKNLLAYPAVGIVLLVIIGWLAMPPALTASKPVAAQTSSAASSQTTSSTTAAGTSSGTSSATTSESTAKAATGTLPTTTSSGAAASSASTSTTAAAQSVGLQRVRDIVNVRCIECHSAHPTQPGFASAPAGIMFDSDAELVQYAAKMKQVVASKYMPLGNMTKMTDAERASIAAWNPKQ